MTLSAAILVGGKGTRLRSLVSDVPKSLASVAGEPFLFLILRKLASAGIKKIILLTGYLHEQIHAACGDGHQFGLEIQYSQEHEPLGTAGALGNARALFDLSSEFLLLNGDTDISSSLSSFIQFQQDPNAMGVLGIMQPEDTGRYGSVAIEIATGKILSFKEKNDKSTGFVSAGLYKLSPRIFDFIPPNVFSALEYDIFPKLLDQGYLLQSFTLDGELHDIGLPESYTHFNLDRMIHSPDLALRLKECFLESIANFDKEQVE